MTNSNLELVLNDKLYSFREKVFSLIGKYDLNAYEFALVLYFLNQCNLEFNVNDIKNRLVLDEKIVLNAFTSLCSKGLIDVKMVKNNNIVKESIDTSNITKSILAMYNKERKENIKDSIFDSFEKEFGRCLSPYEYEIINAWLDKGINEELIKAALKEATFSGTSNLRYIDKIIYEWDKKGFKSPEDVLKHMKKDIPNKNEKKELFDYNWLEDE